MDQKPDDVELQHSESGKIGRSTAAELKTDVDYAGLPAPELDRMRITIEKTEARLVETLNAIQEKLSLENMTREAGEKIQEAAVRRIEIMAKRFGEMGAEIGHSTVESLKHNPVPVALLGLGLGWFLVENLMGRSEEKEQPRQAGPQRGSEYYHEGEHEEPRAAMRGAVQRAKETAGEAREKAGEIAEQFKERAKHLSETVQHRAHEARSGASRMIEERPLAVGLVGLTVGALIGLITAGAFREDGLVSETRESLKQKAGELVHDTREKAGRVMEKARRAAKEEAERQHMVTH